MDVTVIGKVAKDAEMKSVKGDKFVLNFSIADTVGYGERKKLTWVSVSYFINDKQQWLQSALKKDRLVYVVGEGHTETYDRKDGTKGFAFKVDARRVKPVEAPAASPTDDMPALPADNGEEDDIPW